jgi:REP element-mobilizing transposase RayT
LFVDGEGNVAYDPERHHRRSIRLRDFDYASPGGYFVTICVQNSVPLFGQVAHGEMRLNPAGRMIREVWLALPARSVNLQLDEVVVMPNHFHGIAELASAFDAAANSAMEEGVVARAAPTAPPQFTARPQRPALFDISGAFKSITTDVYIAGVKQHGWPRFDRRLWHRNYYEHVVRDDADLARIRNHIRYNPAHWHKDDFNRT